MITPRYQLSTPRRFDRMKYQYVPFHLLCTFNPSKVRLKSRMNLTIRPHCRDSSLEDNQARRKLIEEGQRGMTKGAQVVCSDKCGHADKLTPGVAYDILDERPDDLLIRIEDDRGKTVWLPKSHFDLV